MKTTKLILSIALVALTTTSFGQLSSIKERLFNKQNNKVEYITAEYSNNESSRIETWMHDLHSWASNRASRTSFEAPVVTRAIFIEHVEVIYEEELGLENWMATPFECCVGDEVLSLESWMTTPFKSEFAEEELCMETWMVAPFESTIVDEELILESWMTAPFEIAEVIEVEEWMTAAWI